MRMNGFLILKFIYVMILIESIHTASLQSDRNIDVTAKYYKRLINGDSNQLSELNMFLTAMPKGGDLHHHYSGSIYVETYLEWIQEFNYCVYREDETSLQIKKFTIETNAGALSATAKSLCITADEIRQNNDFYRELLKRWSNIDYSNHFHEQIPPDKQFFDTFGYFNPVSSKNYKKGLMWLKNTALAENVQYIETMLKSSPKLNVANELNVMIDKLTSQSDDADIERSLTMFYDAVFNDSNVNSTIQEYVKTIETSAEGINDENFTLYFQTYVTRNDKPSRIFGGMYSAMVSDLLSNLIVGVNIVGPENGVISMRDYTLHMKMFRFLKKRFPNVNLAMHAGELVLGLVPPEGLQSHVREAVEIAGAKRIGHGIDIFYEHNSYELLAQMKRLDVAVEAVVTSNAFILGVRNDGHPMLVYKAHGVPLVIATDDAGVSRSTLTNEYWMYCDRYEPTYQELKSLIYNSIRYAFLDENEKQKQINKLDDRFENFEEMIKNVLIRLDQTEIINSSAKTFSKVNIFPIILSFIVYFHLSY